MTRTDEIERELAAWYVTPAWVARYYDVQPMQVHRAIADGRLKAVRIRGKWVGRGRDALVLDVRKLPKRWRKGTWQRRNGRED